MVRLVYPAYLNGYEKPLGVLDAWAEIMPRLLFLRAPRSFCHGNTRQSLFNA
jgi:hypothetical protein